MSALDNKVFPIISDLLEKEGVEGYVIGGFVRDFFLERGCKDIDIVVLGSGLEIAEKLGAILHCNVSLFKNFGTAMLRRDDLEIEFVGARKESYNRDSRKPIVENGTLEDDQNRRDFTINAMAFSLNAANYGQLIDPFGGMEDLHVKIIRTPLDPDITFSDDPLRMIRAIRFSTQLGFTIEKETFAAIARNAERIKIVSVERISTEIEKIMLSEKPSVGFKLLDECGLMKIMFPFLHNLKGVEIRKGRAHKDNFYHTLTVLDNVAAMDGGKLWLRWAALLHDVAKPATKGWEDGVGWTFHGHEVVGAKMANKIFKELRLPLGTTLDYVKKLIFLHLRPIALAKEGVS
ncbi:MAG: HD domain-containing protein, partial [Rikenellaceae bacterium]